MDGRLMAYDVPKLTDFSAAALETAARELLAALAAEASAVRNDGDWKVFRDRWMARKNGVLTLSVPKKPEVQPKKIAIGAATKASTDKAKA